MNARLILRADADGTPEWLEQRTKGIGGTDAAHLINGTKSRLALWREKTGEAEPEPVTPEVQARFDYGHSREPELARIFTRRTGLRVRNTGTWAAKAEPWMLANPDRFVGSDGILEIKTTGPYTEAGKMWKAGQVPAHAWVQVHWYAHVTNRTRLWFIAEVDRQPIILGPFNRDEDLIATLVETTTAFWASVTARQEPAPTAPDDMKIAYPVSAEGKVVEIEPWSDTAADLDRIRLICARIKELQAEEKRLTAGVQAEMGDAEELTTTGGTVLATWKSTAPRRTLSKDALVDAGLDPEDYMRAGKPSRRFMLKEAN